MNSRCAHSFIRALSPNKIGCCITNGTSKSFHRMHRQSAKLTTASNKLKNNSKTLIAQSNFENAQKRYFSLSCSFQNAESFEGHVVSVNCML